jgi:signal transduction histidine kinase
VSRVAATLAVFALGILLSLYLSWSFSWPLHRLTEAARRVAQGDLAVQVPTDGGGEIGSLARSFNEMVALARAARAGGAAALRRALHRAGPAGPAVAHEIRNPLNFINLSMDHVREKLHPEDPARRESFDKILGNVKGEISRLNRLVNDVLSFGRPMRLDRRACSIGRLLHEVAARVDHKAKDQGIALTVDAEPGLPRVIADPELLKTCFLNLMINGLDAMPEGGRLAASVRRETSGAGSVLRVEVSDRGAA